MKRTFGRLLAVLLAAVLLALPLTACSSEVDTYKEEISASVEALGKTVTAFNDAMEAFDGSESSAAAMLDSIKACKESSQAVAAVKAPDKVSEAHALFTQASQDLGDAMDLYDDVFRHLSDYDQDQLTEKLTEAQDLMINASDKLLEAAAAVDQL